MRNFTVKSVSGILLKPFLAMIAVLVLFGGNIAAQTGSLQLMVMISPNVSPYISDWETDPNMVIARINSLTNQNIAAILAVSVNSSRYGEVFNGESPPIIVNASDVQDIATPDLVAWNDINYNEALEQQIFQTGRIPEDDYELCVQLFSADTRELLDEQCQNFQIFIPEPPSLVMPGDNEIIDNPFLTFQCTPVIWHPGHPAIVLIRIAPLQEGQTPEQAIEGNVPHFEGEMPGGTTLIYPPEGLPFEPGESYVWQVQAVDQNGTPIGENGGRSEIWQFIFQPEQGGVAVITPEDPNVVICQWDDRYFLLPREICESLNGIPGGSYQVGNDTMATVKPGKFAVRWASPPAVVLPDDQVMIEAKSAVETDAVSAVSFAYRDIGDTSWTEIASDGDGSDGFAATWPLEELAPGVYETRVGAVNGRQQYHEANVLTAKYPLLNINAGSPIGQNIQQANQPGLIADVEASTRQGWQGVNQKNRQQAANRFAKLDPEAKRRAELAAKRDKMQELLNQLVKIDSLLEAVPNTYKPKIRAAMDALKKLPAPPPGSSIQAEVDKAKALSDSCKAKLDKLKKEQADLEKERDDLKKQQDDLLKQMDDLHHSNGYTGGHGWYSSGSYHWGYVKGGKSGLPYGTPAYNQYTDIKNQLKDLNKRYKNIIDKLKDYPDRIKKAEEECRKLAKALQDAQKIKSKQDMATAQMNDCARQIHSLLQTLAQWCKANPGLCTFKDLLDRLMQTSPQDAAGWNQFWADFNQLINAKKAVERDLKKKIGEADDEIEGIDDAAQAAADAERKRKEEEERLKKLMGDGPPMPTPKEIPEEKLVFGLTDYFRELALDANLNPNDCKNKCLLAMDDILGNNYVELLRGVANAAWMGAIKAMLSMTGLSFLPSAIAGVVAGQLLKLVNSPDLVPFGGLNNYHYKYSGLKRGQRVDIDCKINASFFFNPKTCYVRGFVTCKCCGEEKLLFVKYKVNEEGYPVDGTKVSRWMN